LGKITVKLLKYTKLSLSSGWAWQAVFQRSKISKKVKGMYLFHIRYVKGMFFEENWVCTGYLFS
jgi:hypothetical protein